MTQKTHKKPSLGSLGSFGSFGIARVVLLAIVGVLLTLSSGCYQRQIAPEVKYDPAAVNVLKSRVQEMDWE